MLRYSWYGQMSPGQLLPGQMSPWQLKSIQYGPRNLPFKFGQNRASNSWDIAGIEFVVVGGGWVVVVFSSFRVKLGWVEVGVLIILFSATMYILERLGVKMRKHKQRKCWKTSWRSRLDTMLSRLIENILEFYKLLSRGVRLIWWSNYKPVSL